MTIGPEVVVPTLEGRRVVYPALIAAVWLVLKVGVLLIDGFFARLKKSFVYRTGIDPFGWRELTDSSGSTESQYTVEILKDWLEWEQQRWRRRVWEAFHLIVRAPIREEAIYRGLPYLLALTLTEHRVPLLLIGSAIWAYLHGRNPSYYQQKPWRVFITGLLYVYLWTAGLWLVAVVLHAANNAIAVVLLNIYEGWKEWRHPLSVGEEYVVSVEEQSSQSNYGLYRAFAPEHDRIYVAGIDPGETARVRVATTIGQKAGYAYPIDRSPTESG